MLDILIFAAHPDDVELACGGYVVKEIQKGKRVGIIDLTRGEMGTRGTPELRAAEAAEATEILGVQVRENLGMADCFFENDRAHQLQIIQKIRQYQPKIVLANAITDRHPDHGRAAQLVKDASFLAGVGGIKTELNGEPQKHHRPQLLLHYIQDRYIAPNIIVDITPQWETKKKAIQAFKSQFYDPNSTEPATYISSPDFINSVEARAQELGKVIGVRYGEGFVSERVVGIDSLLDLH